MYLVRNNELRLFIIKRIIHRHIMVPVSDQPPACKINFICTHILNNVPLLIDQVLIRLNEVVN
jgi:hypothetical protein